MVRFSLVTGMHRSGTTFVGRLLAACRRTASLHEPFNPEYGSEGVDRVYPYAARDLEEAKLNSLVNCMLSLECRVHSRVAGEPLLKQYLRQIIGGRTARDQIKLRLMKKFGLINDIIIKDPFLLLLTEYLSLQYSIRSVVIVRHPIAIWHSVNRMGWRFDFQRFASKEFLSQQEETKSSARFNLQVEVEKLDSLPELEKLATLWVLLYGAAVFWAAKDSNILLVKHEDLCYDPIGQVSRITQHLGLTCGKPLQKRIDRWMQGNVAVVQNKRLHNFHRDSRGLAWAWMNKTDTAIEKRISAIAEDLVVSVYGAWRPTLEEGGRADNEQ